MTEIVTPSREADRVEARSGCARGCVAAVAGVVFWTQMRKSPLAIAGGVVLAIFYLLALFAPFVAPYPQEEMDRARYFHPPQSAALGRAPTAASACARYVREMRAGRS